MFWLSYLCCGCLNFILCNRFPIEAGKGYDAVQTYFEDSLLQSTGIYNNLHGLIVEA
jgi:endonuclease III-like uncharacterized protein